MNYEMISLMVTGQPALEGAATGDMVAMMLNAGPMVKMVLLLLLLFSTLSWGIIIYKAFQINRARRQSYYFLEMFWKSKNLSTAYTESQTFGSSPVAEMFRVGYMELSRIWKSASTQTSADITEISVAQASGVENVKRALRRAQSVESTRLTSYLPFLATTGNTTPFVGLFGTVWGIMSAFRDIGLSGAANLAVVAPGISEALITTAAGLAAAIPAVIAYNYYVSKVRVIEAEMNNFVHDFLNILDREMLKKLSQKQING